METKRKRVVILGAGFGGLWAAKNMGNTDLDVLVVDKNNYHTFLPLLYQVAAAMVGPDEIAAPVRGILRKYKNVRFLMESVQRVDLDARIVHTECQSIPYDYLVMALGSVAFFFGVPGAAEHAWLLKDLEQGIALRNHLLARFEAAEYESNPEERKKLLTFAIVGGGPTGVEFAGALAELIHGPLRRDHSLDMREVRIVLLEAMPRLLNMMPDKLGEYTRRRLAEMGVEVRLNAAVSEVSGQAVKLKDGTVIPTETVVWTAGVRAEPIAESAGLVTARNGQVVVTSTLQAQDHPEVYVIGDQSRRDERGTPLPMVAPVAIQQGAWAARNIKRAIAGQEPLPFHYKDRGSMVTIGRNHGVAVLFGRGFRGFPAWLVWLGVHIFNLIGFRNRLAVLLSWAADYIFLERKVRLILPGETVIRNSTLSQTEEKRVETQST